METTFFLLRVMEHKTSKDAKLSSFFNNDFILCLGSNVFNKNFILVLLRDY